MFNIQVVKKGNVFPRLPPYNPLVWLDSSDVVMNGSTVSKWNDRTGNGYNATAAGGLQPTIAKSFFKTKDALNFNGSKAMTISSLPLGNYTIFTILNASANGIIFEHGPNGYGTPGCYLYSDVTFSAAVTRGATAESKDLSASWALGSVSRIIANVYDGTDAGFKLYINNTNQSLSGGGTSPGSSVVTDSFYIGARTASSVFINGYYGCILIYNTALSASQISDVFVFLNQWSIY